MSNPYSVFRFNGEVDFELTRTALVAARLSAIKNAKSSEDEVIKAYYALMVDKYTAIPKRFEAILGPSISQHSTEKE